MAISDEQRELRAKRLGSSDAVRIMEGRWTELWREKTGRAEPPDLEFVPAVQIGIATEPLHAKFYAQRAGIGCFPACERSHVHPAHDFLVAHLDFLTWTEAPSDPHQPPDTVLEAKFTSGFKSDEELVEQYYWQLQHQMLVADLPRAILSVLRPTGYSFVPVGRDEADGAVLLETLKTFWWHVENDVEPADPWPVDAPAFDRLRVVDMSAHNEFAALGGTLVDRRVDVQVYRAAEVRLKALMPDGVRVAFLPGRRVGTGMFLARTRDGRLSLRFGDVPRKYRDRAEPWLPDLASFDPK